MKFIFSKPRSDLFSKVSTFFYLAEIFQTHMSTMRSLNKPHFKLQNHLLSFVIGIGHAKFGFKTIIRKPNEIQNTENVKYSQYTEFIRWSDA